MALSKIPNYLQDSIDSLPNSVNGVIVNTGRVDDDTLHDIVYTAAVMNDDTVVYTPTRSDSKIVATVAITGYATRATTNDNDIRAGLKIGSYNPAGTIEYWGNSATDFCIGHTNVTNNTGNWYYHMTVVGTDVPKNSSGNVIIKIYGDCDQDVDVNLAIQRIEANFMEYMPQ